MDGYGIIKVKKHKMDEDKKFVEAAVEGGTLKTEAESFAVGAEATFTPTDGQPVPAEGSYKLDNGTTVVCVAGKVTEVKEAEATMDPEVEQAIQRAMKPVVEAMRKEVEKQFNDKLEALKVELKNTQGKSTGKTDEKEPTLTPAEKVRLFITKKK